MLKTSPTETLWSDVAIERVAEVQHAMIMSASESEFAYRSDCAAAGDVVRQSLTRAYCQQGTSERLLCMFSIASDLGIDEFSSRSDDPSLGRAFPSDSPTDIVQQLYFSDSSDCQAFERIDWRRVAERDAEGVAMAIGFVPQRCCAQAIKMLDQLVEQGGVFDGAGSEILRETYPWLKARARRAGTYSYMNPRLRANKQPLPTLFPTLGVTVNFPDRNPLETP